jgi:hypothetical protein
MNNTAYKALLSTSEEIGWPIHYRTDLEKHDKVILENYHGKSFGWILRKYGTVFIEEPTSLEHAEFNKQTIEFYYKGYGKDMHLYHIYDGENLKLARPEKLLEKFGQLESFQVAV